MHRFIAGRILPICLLALLPGPALAHVLGAHGAGFAQGFSHPFGGIDHLLAMFAVGVWAAQRGGRAVWLLPASFMAMLAAGAGLALAGVPLAFAETGIAVSLLVLGTLLTATVPLPLPLAMVLVGCFAIAHGHAHGSELPEAALPWLYGLGFLGATALLHGLGVALGMAAGKPLAHLLVRASGLVVALLGVGLLLA